MSILKSEILTRANTLAKRSETDIDHNLREILLELSEACHGFKTTTTETVAATISNPTDAICIDAIHVDDGSETGITLDEIPLDDLLNEIKDGFTIRNDNILIYTAEDHTGETCTIYYERYHNTDVSADTCIEFHEKFRAAIEHGVAYKILADYGITQKQTEQYQLYQNELMKLTGSDTDTPSTIKSYTRLSV